MEASPSSQMARLHMKLQSDERSRVFARLADELRLSGHVEDAVELLQKGIQSHPDYGSGHVVLGKCYLDLGALEDAREAFLRALALDAENIFVLKTLGDILFQQGALDEAAKRYQRALELDFRNTDIREVVEKLRSQHGENPSAEPEEEPPVVAPMGVSQELPSETQGRELPTLDEEKSVAEPAAELTELSPEETELLREGEGEEASKGPPRGMATATLGEIYLQQGLLEKAIETYQKVLRHRPEDQEAKDRLKELRAMRSSKTRRKKSSHKKPLQIPKPSVDLETDAPPEADIQGEG
jgi:tetratricopeptide (TPR) repeat protein